MATSSTEAGYLLPSDEPIRADPLDDALHDCIMGIVGAIPGQLIRPRWQVEPPAQPDFDVDWVAFGVVRTIRDTFAHAQHEPAGAGADVMSRDELLFVLLSFYGPNSAQYAERFSMGVQVTQNREPLRQIATSFVEVQEAITLPALLKQKWVRRVDITAVLRRRVAFTYPIANVESAGVDLDNEHYVTPIIPPTP